MASNKKYWQSVEELKEGSIVETLSKNEFVEEIPTDEFLGDKETLEASSTSRRDFLKYVGFTTAAASLAACEGALLVVDAAQGVEAQTLANVYLALENDLEVVPVINKIDLPAADVEKVRSEIEDIIGIPADEAVLTSAKSGIGSSEANELTFRTATCPERSISGRNPCVR